MKMNNQKLYLCPCCGSESLGSLREYEICPVCDWEDDPVQFDNPDLIGGANSMSLNQARDQWFKNH
jgi:hypothetical protein